MKRILVTGSRTWTDTERIMHALMPYRWSGATLVHGGAQGADLIAAETWASWGLPVEVHPADWATYGQAAGYIRNAKMVELGANICLAFWKDQSRGTGHTINLASAAGIPIRIYRETST